MIDERITENRDGVVVAPAIVNRDDRAMEDVTIEYDGELKNHGAGEIYLHAGVGNEHTPWEETKTIKMEQTAYGTWRTKVRLNNAESFNFCFKDSAENWDNNNGENWEYRTLSSRYF